MRKQRGTIKQDGKDLTTRTQRHKEGQNWVCQEYNCPINQGGETPPLLRSCFTLLINRPTWGKKGSSDFLFCPIYGLKGSISPAGSALFCPTIKFIQDNLIGLVNAGVVPTGGLVAGLIPAEGALELVQHAECKGGELLSFSRVEVVALGFGDGS